MKMARQREEFRQRMSGTQETHASLKDAVRRRREDWEMGPLAPQRDTPLRDETGAYWGSISLRRNLADNLPEKQRDLACRWAGGRKTLCIKAGDRVAIMDGPDKGKISTIQYVQEEGGFVALEGDNLKVSLSVDTTCGPRAAVPLGPGAHWWANCLDPRSKTSRSRITCQICRKTRSRSMSRPPSTVPPSTPSASYTPSRTPSQARSAT